MHDGGKCSLRALAVRNTAVHALVLELSQTPQAGMPRIRRQHQYSSLR